MFGQTVCHDLTAKRQLATPDLSAAEEVIGSAALLICLRCNWPRADLEKRERGGLIGNYTTEFTLFVCRWWWPSVVSG